MNKRMLSEISLFLLIVFTFTFIGPFTMVPSHAHQLCSGCPTEDSTDTYCYSCNTEHNHIEEALDSEISSAQALLADTAMFEGEVESYSASTMEEVNIKNSILGGLGGLVTTVTGAIATGLSIKAIIASGGTATPAAIWTARAGVAATVGGGVATFINFKNAFNGITARYKKIKCPQCEKKTTQAELDGWSNTSGEHAFVTCTEMAMGKDGSLYICNVSYRKCRGQCPNFAAHAMTCDGCLVTYRYDTKTSCTHYSQGHSWQQP